MEKLLRKMTLEELVGQWFMVGFHGNQYNSDLDFFLKKLHIGGLILFKRNVEEPGQVAALCRQVQEKAVDAVSVPLFISIDQEGGTVSRLGPPFSQFPSASSMAAAPDPEQEIQRFAQRQARELKLVGINMNLAPVLDVNRRGPEGLMASRSLGSDPQEVARLGTLCIRELQQAGVIACAKHFPGIGDTELDSHQDLPVQMKDRVDLEEVELIPFREAVKIPVGAVMTAHVRYPVLDPLFPASLSAAVIRDLLRREMGYQGLVMTDDLEMGAISLHFEIEEAVLSAAGAGSDGLLICHTPEKIERAYRSLLRRVKNGGVSDQAFKETLLRIFDLKYRFLQAYLPASEKEIAAYFSDRKTG